MEFPRASTAQKIDKYEGFFRTKNCLLGIFKKLPNQVTLMIEFPPKCASPLRRFYLAAEALSLVNPIMMEAFVWVLHIECKYLVSLLPSTRIVNCTCREQTERQREIVKKMEQIHRDKNFKNDEQAETGRFCKKDWINTEREREKKL